MQRQQRFLPGHFRRAIASSLAAVAFCGAFVPASPAAAQNSPFGWFQHLFQPLPPQPMPQQPVYRRAVPQPRVARPKPVAEKPADKPAEKPKSASAAAVVVLGDSLGQLLGQGLTEAFADNPDVVVKRKARESSGLVRDDFYDWPKAVRELVDGKERVDMAVMMIGSNDRQALRGSDGTFEPPAGRWRELYKARVAAIVEQFRARKIPLVWVGLPIAKSERLSADMAAFNDLYRETVTKAGGTYVDVWEAFGDDRGQYSAFGPDLGGQITKLRAADGLHFTHAGARKLAHFVEGEVHRQLDAVAAPPETDMLPPVAKEPGQPPAAAKPVPADTDTPTATILPPKPEAGPVLSLTAPAIAPDGLLVSRRGDKGADTSDALVQRALTQGRPLPAQPGRADDFAWRAPR